MQCCLKQRTEVLSYGPGSWKWIEKNKGKHKDIVADKNGVFLKIKDEEEIFEIADSYLDAVAEGNVKKYWETF